MKHALLRKQLPGIKNNSSLRTITNTADETRKMWFLLLSKV
jgi:hypothetical protein